MNGVTSQKTITYEGSYSRSIWRCFHTVSCLYAVLHFGCLTVFPRTISRPQLPSLTMEPFLCCCHLYGWILALMQNILSMNIQLVLRHAKNDLSHLHRQVSHSCDAVSWACNNGRSCHASRSL